MRGFIKIKGHSGCRVEVVSAEGRLWVEKSAPSRDYARRFRRQIRKQRDARRSNTLDSVIIPEILHEWELPRGGHAVRMEYLQLRDCIEFYSMASLRDVEGIARILLDYLEANLSRSSMEPLEGAKLKAKLQQVEEALGSSSHSEEYRPFFAQLGGRAVALDGLPIPLGPTHGDLTLSNVMMAGDASCIGLFDFLDSYLESPLVDIAKLRQDTQFGWSQLMAEDPLDRVRFLQIMGYTDAMIVRHFQGQEWFRRGIDLVQGINLLRIAPYATTEAVHRFILRALTTLELDS